MDKNWDVFISHASEDKTTFVKELADKLSSLSVKVWYDEFTLKIGDSLSEKIDEGLLKSNYGIIVISKKFISKNWTDYELRSLLTKEIGFKKVILPIWFNISYEEVKNYSLFLADKYALKSENGVDNEIVMKLLEVIRPDIFENFARYLLFHKAIKKGKTKKANPRELKISPIQHDHLPQSQLNRIKTIFFGIGKYLNLSLEDSITNYKRDIYPQREIQIWEIMNTTFLEFLSKNNYEEEIVKKDIAKILLMFSIGELPKESIIPLEEIEELAELYKSNLTIKH